MSGERKLGRLERAHRPVMVGMDTWNAMCRRSEGNKPWKRDSPAQSTIRYRLVNVCDSSLCCCTNEIFTKLPASREVRRNRESLHQHEVTDRDIVGRVFASGLRTGNNKAQDLPHPWISEPFLGLNPASSPLTVGLTAISRSHDFHSPRNNCPLV